MRPTGCSEPIEKRHLESEVSCQLSHLDVGRAACEKWGAQRAAKNFFHNGRVQRRPLTASDQPVHSDAAGLSNCVEILKAGKRSAIQIIVHRRLRHAALAGERVHREVAA